MDSSDDDDDRQGGDAVDGSQLDGDGGDAFDALYEEEIAAALQDNSDDAGGGGDAEPPTSDDERKDRTALKRPARGGEERKESGVDSDTEPRSTAAASASASASTSAAAASTPAAASAAKRRPNKDAYQRREQRRRAVELEQSHIRASMPSAAALRRYETFRRARLSHSTLKSLIQQCTGSNKVEGQLPAILSAMGRVYVGVVVEEARRAMRAMGHTGNVRPMHLREAHRRLADRGDIVVPHCSDGRRRAIGVAGWRRNGQFFRQNG